MFKGMVVAGFLLMLLVPCAFPQPSESTVALLRQFDNEHDLAAKEHLLLTITNAHPDAGPSLLRLAESTKNSDTRWMAMRGLATLHYVPSVPFLETSLKDSDAAIRANAARALGDLRIRNVSEALLAMFAAERDPGAVQQSSLALQMLDIKAAAPAIREKIPMFTGQTRSWLIQALGVLGNISDVPSIAEYLDGETGDIPAMESATVALQELTGVDFGIRPSLGGLTVFPTRETVAAREWWNSHKARWPRCDDCHPK